MGGIERVVVIELLKSYKKKEKFIKDLWSGKLDIKFLEYHKIDMLYFFKSNEKYLDVKSFNYLNNKKRIHEEHNEKYKEIAERLTEEFEIKDISHVFLKGIFCSEFLYPKKWIRYYGDIDLLIEKTNIKKVEKILKKEDFVFGKADTIHKSIITASRRDILFQQTFTHEIYNMVRKEKEWFSNVDTNFLFSWNGFENSLYNKTINDFKDHIVKKGKLYFFDNITNFLHMCCHLYNEAVYFQLDKGFSGGDPKEIQLNRIFDIVLLADKFNQIDFDSVLDISEKQKILEKVQFSMKLINCLLGEKTINCNNKLMEYDSINLNIYVDENSEVKEWEISPIERVFDLNKKNEVSKILFPERSK
ncbi:nucleotidyltransferase family protein [Pseudolactococcus reticulitermitis]|uniref:Uncharacterized protein n=1 Tax=Pseudolactococcus reticulitermitis TaxID=2025039 RepID=A0A224X1X4_9LACT|nr:nucleotidyltransferase family protein [Lactococcus reticulitermitis]GAX46876.1 hypothetical protein RsY01_456 [Lactococcus reticulitermitis]